jgi:serine/threonine protein phosphatase PrpC
MTIELYPPLALHEQGKREGNEDYIYPPIGSMETEEISRFFLVCDGVGGAEKGEEASRIACETFAKHLGQKAKLSEADIVEAMTLTEKAMDDYIVQHQDSTGMATTLTLVFFDDEGAAIAHVGDSRVYHIRDGEILFKTFDHSLVNELILSNIINEEQALSHPKRNVVTRAIMGGHRPTTAEFTRIVDVQEGDYFFLCTDGILESLTDALLVERLKKKDTTDKEKIEGIFTLCQQGSRDNFSAYLIKVKSANSAVQKSVPTFSAPKEERHRFKYHNAFIGLSLIAVLVVALQAVFLFKKDSKKATPYVAPNWIDSFFQDSLPPVNDSVDFSDNYVLTKKATLVLDSIAQDSLGK